MNGEEQKPKLRDREKLHTGTPLPDNVICLLELWTGSMLQASSRSVVGIIYRLGANNAVPLPSFCRLTAPNAMLQFHGLRLRSRKSASLAVFRGLIIFGLLHPLPTPSVFFRLPQWHQESDLLQKRRAFWHKMLRDKNARQL